jgi:hypothetical protein
MNNILTNPELAVEDKYMLIALQLVTLMATLPAGGCITLTYPGWPTYTLNPLTPAQSAAFSALPRRHGKVLFHQPLSSVLQGILNPIFFSAGGPPPNWTWPIVP